MICFKVDDVNEMNAQLNNFLHFLKVNGADDDAVFDSRLVCCELITNVLRHCGCGAIFKGELNGGVIKITVRAEEPVGEIRVPDLPSVLAEGGRGLYIVNAVSKGNVFISNGTVTVKLSVKQR